MTTDERAAASDLDGFRPVIPANRYYLNHMLKHVERCIDTVDEWLVQRKVWRGKAAAQLARKEPAEIPEFDLPDLWLPTSVAAYLPESKHELTPAAIHQHVEQSRKSCRSIETSQKRYDFILEADCNLAVLMRAYVRPYEQLRLEIWTRLQQLDVLDPTKRDSIPPDLIELPNALSIEKMVDQWFSDDPQARMAAFTLSGPLNLEVNLIERTVSRSDMKLAGKPITVSFASNMTGWIPFIVAFFSGRNGLDEQKIDETCDSMLLRHSSSETKDRKRLRNKYIRDANNRLSDLRITIATNLSLQPVHSN